MTKEEKLQEIKNKIFDLVEEEYNLDLGACNLGPHLKTYEEDRKKNYEARINRLSDYYDVFDNNEEELIFNDYSWLCG